MTETDQQRHSPHRWPWPKGSPYRWAREPRRSDLDQAFADAKDLSLKWPRTKKDTER